MAFSALCSSKLCLVNHLPRERKNVKWIFCDKCQNYFHFECSTVFSPTIKLHLGNQKTWCCKECEQWDFPKHKSETLKAMNGVETELQNVLNSLNEVANKRLDLESLLHRSTGAVRRKYEMFLSSIDCDLRTWYQKEANIDSIFDILRDTPRNSSVRKAMKGLAKIMSCSSNCLYTKREIDELELMVHEFLEDMKVALNKEAITPKLHLIAFHLIPYMRKHKTWGKTSEQGIEHIHARVNMLKRRFQPIRNLVDRSRLIVDELSISNWLHDTGVLSD